MTTTGSAPIGAWKCNFSPFEAIMIDTTNRQTSGSDGRNEDDKNILVNFIFSRASTGIRITQLMFVVGIQTTR